MPFPLLLWKTSHKVSKPALGNVLFSRLMGVVIGQHPNKGEAHLLAIQNTNPGIRVLETGTEIIH